MTDDTSKSRALFERAMGVVVEGGSSPSRGPTNYGDYPLFIERDRGSRIQQYDGLEPALHSVAPLAHSEADVQATVGAVKEALMDGR